MTKNIFAKGFTILLLILFFFTAFIIPCTASPANNGRINYETENNLDKQSDFTPAMGIVIGLIIIIIILFIWEPIRIDLIALSIPVFLVILNPWTKISVEESIIGFSNPATITIIAMFIISAAVYRCGIIQILIEKITDITGNNNIKQIFVISGLSGLFAGIINNTAIVAMFIPMVKELARRTKKSPSKLLIPLSFGAMMGGMLTLIGTNTNLLASNISERLTGQGFSFFEFTHIGLIALATGIIYLITIGKHLIPARISPEEEITEEYKMGDYLTEVRIRKNSPLIGKTIAETFEQFDYDIELIQLTRKGESFVEPLANKYLQENDHLIIRTDQKTLLEVLRDHRLQLLPGITVTQKYLEEEEEKEKNKPSQNNEEEGQKVIEIIIPNDSFMIGQTLREVNFVERYNASVLAVRHGRKLTHTRLEDIVFEPGDILLLVASETTMERFRQNRNFIVSNELETTDYRPSKMFLTLGILTAVVLFAVFNILPIVTAAIGGVILMVITGCLNPTEIYESVNWEIIFLLAGVIPLGEALEKTHTAAFLANNIVTLANILSPLTVLILFYIITVLLTNAISRNASLVFMLPVAVDTAGLLEINPFAIVLTVTFAAGCSFLTPVGNQINLMIYGPGGYRFKDFIKVGAPLQLIYTLLIPFLISVFFPI